MSNGERAPGSARLEIIAVIVGMLAILVSLVADLGFFRRAVGIAVAITLTPVVIIWLRLGRKVKARPESMVVEKPIKYLMKESPCPLTFGFLLSVVFIANLLTFLFPEFLENSPTVQICLGKWGVTTPTPTQEPTPTFSPTPTPTPTIGPCTPTPGSPHVPRLIADRLWYTLNGGPEQSVQQLDILYVTPGDRLCLLRLEYHPDGTPDPADAAHGEAYIRKPGINSCDGFDYDDGQFWLGDCVESGANELTTINPHTGDGCWTLGEGWDRLVVALVHNGTFGWEVDHRFFVQLVPR